MSKVSIDEQIEAVGWVLETEFRDGFRERIEAVRDTLQWIKANADTIKAIHKAKADPAVKRVLEEFPGAMISDIREPGEDDDV